MNNEKNFPPNYNEEDLLNASLAEKLENENPEGFAKAITLGHYEVFDENSRLAAFSTWYRRAAEREMMRYESGLL